jgi:hypothetical protein
MSPLWRLTAVWLAFVVLVSGCTAPSVNHAPSIKSWEPKGDARLAEDGSLTFWLNASDLDGHTIKCSWFVDGILNATSEPPFTFTFGAGRGIGNHTIKAVVSDGSITAVRTWNVEIYKVNHPPVVSVVLPSGREPPVNEGGQLEFRATATDPDGDSVNMTWLLDGKTVAQGQGNYTYSPGYDMAGLHNVRLNASDGTASTEVEWNVTVVNVNRAPRIINDTPSGDPRLTETGTVAFHAEGIDDDGDPVSLSWSLDGTRVGGAQDFIYAPDYFSEGTHEISVTASDGSLSARRSWNVTVDNINRPPEIFAWSPDGDRAASEWDIIPFTVEGHDPDDDKLQVDWFLDNATAPAASGANFNYTPGYHAAGNHTVRSVISDGNSSVMRSWNVSVRRAVSNWTVLAYMNADNDLEPYIIEDLNEMESAGSTTSVNIVVQMDRHPSYDASNGDWKGARRYRVEKDADSQLIASTMLEDIGEVDMGAEATLRGFLLWGAENFPSERCMVVMSGHGDGWNGISQDFTDLNHKLSVDSVAASLAALAGRRGAPVDVLELDVCYWAMLETSWGLNGSVDYIVASEDIDPSPGQSWGPLLRGLVARPEMTAVELARAAVSAFAAGYSETMSSPEDNATFTQSALNVSMLAPLADDIDDLCVILRQNITASSLGIADARKSARSFGRPEYIDIYDFARLLRQNSTSDALNSSAEAVMDAVVRAVVAEAHGKDRQGAFGISIYFPAYSYAYNQAYGELALSHDAGWCGLLLAYYNTTGRAAGGLEPTGNNGRAAGGLEPAGHMGSSGPGGEGRMSQAGAASIPMTGRTFDAKERY